MFIASNPLIVRRAVLNRQIQYLAFCRSLDKSVVSTLLFKYFTCSSVVFGSSDSFEVLNRRVDTPNKPVYSRFPPKIMQLMRR